MSDDDYDLKPCARCGASIPAVARMCAQCGTSDVDGAAGSKPARPVLPGFARRGGRGIDVTKTLIIVNIVFYGVSLLVQARVSLGGGILPYLLGGPSGRGLHLAGWFYAPLVQEGQWWRILSATFLHGGLLHIAFNLHALRSLGQMAEGLLGRDRYLVVYFASAACSTVAVGAWTAFEGVRPYPVVGASGAVFGVLGALGVSLLRRGSGRGRVIARSLILNAVILLAIGWFVPVISNTAHVGGLLCGGAIGYFAGDSFTARLSPERARVWAAVAAVFVIAAVLSLVLALHFAVTAPISR